MWIDLSSIFLNEKFTRKDKIKIQEYWRINWISEKTLIQEYLVVLCLEILNDYKDSENLLLKWWSALSLFYWSKRFSMDLDIDLYLNFSINSKKSKSSILSMFEKIKNKKIKEKKWIKYDFLISWWNNIEKYTCKFLFTNEELNIDETIEVDLSFENEWIWVKSKIVQSKKDLYSLKKRCLF